MNKQSFPALKNNLISFAVLIPVCLGVVVIMAIPIVFMYGFAVTCNFLAGLFH